MKKKTSKRTVSEEQMSVDLSVALAAPASEAKVPVYMKLDADIYMELKRRAKQGAENGKYQVLINKLLRGALFGNKESKTDLRDILKRVERLEKARKKAI